MNATPTLYDWAGGRPAFDRLTEVFYGRVRADDVLGAGVRAHARGPPAPRRARGWPRSSAGRPSTPRSHGGYPHMVRKHLGLALTEEQRAAGSRSSSPAATRPACPRDPEFRSAFAAYVEWGTRLALANSQPGAAPPLEAPVPRWGWGEAPPYDGG